MPPEMKRLKRKKQKLTINVSITLSNNNDVVICIEKKTNMKYPKI